MHKWEPAPERFALDGENKQPSRQVRLIPQTVGFAIIGGETADNAGTDFYQLEYKAP